MQTIIVSVYSLRLSFVAPTALQDFKGHVGNFVTA
jgi:hypothetical protein